jgi:hypothetical protein
MPVKAKDQHKLVNKTRQIILLLRFLILNNPLIR